VIIDSSGNLYGITDNGGAAGGGTVFELVPPTTPGGNWTESVLWSFGNPGDGQDPDGHLLIDANGNLYGTTYSGGVYKNAFGSGQGTVFELMPPATPGGNWTESILWNFGNGNDGAAPGRILIDDGGNLYGTTTQGGTYAEGTVFEIGDVLAPPTPTPVPTPTTTLRASPTLLNFGHVLATATSKPEKVTLTNTGAVAALISKVIAIYPFSVGGGLDTCSNHTIAPKKPATLTLNLTRRISGR